MKYINLNSAKNILLTGSDGALGKELIKVLSKRKIKFINTSKSPDNMYFLDILDYERIKYFLDTYKPDIIIHLAAIVPIPIVEKNQNFAFNVNVIGLNNVFKAVEESKIKSKIIVVSSSEVYGNGKLNRKFTESDSFSPNNFYAFTKVAQEELSQIYLKRGLQIVIARIFNYSSIFKKPIYSLESFANQIAKIIHTNSERILEVGNLIPKRDFLQGQDVALALIRIIERSEENNVFNISRGQANSMENLLQKMIKLFKIDLDITVNSKLLRNVENIYVCGDNTKLTSLGWEPSFTEDEMISVLVEYYKNIYRI